MAELKDDRLDRLATVGNVARFASFGPGSEPELRHVRLAADDANPPTDLDSAVRAVLAASASTVNVRSFLADRQKNCPFHYGIQSAAEATALVRSLAADGYYTIVNETVDVHDGGVSGVCLGGLVEFAPDDTPRAVEKPDAAVLGHDLALRVFHAVYGIEPDLPAREGERLEFSLHPRPVGFRQTHTLWWETEEVPPVSLDPRPRWPNRFSRHIGDKPYGLLIAHLLGLPVPGTEVFSRRVAPFRFGTPTGTGKVWTRTAPRVQAPGKFLTVPYRTDPYALMQSEDPDGTALASVLVQEAVDAVWSGASMPGAGDTPDHVEGVAGPGDEFMLGRQSPEPLPAQVIADVRHLALRARKDLGRVRFEWAHDGRQVWVLQAHIARDFFQNPSVLSPGDAPSWLRFEASEGLDRLLLLIEHAERDGLGVEVHGAVGLTSHVGDLLRKHAVPGRLAPTAEDGPA